MQSWDQKTGPEELWWKALTACNDHPAEELNHWVKLQVYDWDDQRWEFAGFGQFGANRFFDDFLANTRFWDVAAYQGLLCYRIETVHFVVEWQKGVYAQDYSHSLGQCY